MDVGSFTIVFPEHLPSARRKYCLDQLADRGGRAEEAGDGVFRIHCEKQSQLELVGWALFQTGLANLCSVTEATGRAELRADTYAIGHRDRHP